MNQTQRKAEGAEKNFERKTNSMCQAKCSFSSPILRSLRVSANPSSITGHLELFAIISIFKIFLPNITVLRSNGLYLLLVNYFLIYLVENGAKLIY